MRRKENGDEPRRGTPSLMFLMLDLPAMSYTEARRREGRLPCGKRIIEPFYIATTKAYDVFAIGICEVGDNALAFEAIELYVLHRLLE